MSIKLTNAISCILKKVADAKWSDRRWKSARLQLRMTTLMYLRTSRGVGDQRNEPSLEGIKTSKNNQIKILYSLKGKNLNLQLRGMMVSHGVEGSDYPT